ncbi:MULTISPECIES: LysR family transcriptional regulator [unclassified Rhizobium]|uniref:choline sulfate utilization transcriptional regulator n=1 Tax=unclassified Rhizobium TaxID=2613769 RepID=UPI0006473624|nr:MULTISPECIES: LysR family transcriptional regulator [unclassified Rhizobium]NKJ05000.1 putative choline sulfate-utilization transcription factor [Rhizobium sp. SG741]NKJ36199.1 putative choline sulfate-utilization transcription factor [Rhizobium sp. SG570]NRP84248.1 Glycine cleavage system transcriptional activator [Ensifer adhaerens]
MAERSVDLGWLRIFLEVGRSGSLSSAALALGLTQPGVSYQIRRIEEQMGVSLFHRQHRGVKLSPEGQRLFEIVEKAVGGVDMLVRSFRAEAERPSVRLRTDYAFSALWLIPRMHAFRLLHPEVDIQIVATQRLDRGAPESSDIVVVFGARNEFGPGATLLLPEKVVPICTRGFADRHGPFTDPSQLARATLVHLDSDMPSPWFDWESYLAAFGIARDSYAGRGDLRFNTYSLVVQAALSEQGVAIGWMGLIDSLLTARTLVTAGPMLEAPGRGYWLLPPAAPSLHAERLAQWLLSEAAIAQTRSLTLP